jgi:hypothetical protein
MFINCGFHPVLKLSKQHFPDLLNNLFLRSAFHSEFEASNHSLLILHFNNGIQNKQIVGME